MGGPAPGSATEYDAKVLPKRFPLNSLANGIWSMDSKIYLHLKRTPSFHVNN